MEGETTRIEGKAKTGSVIGLVIFLLLLGFVLFFIYRVWFYADKIRSGEVIPLPQFRSNISYVRGGLSLGGLPADRETIEKGARPNIGPTENPKVTVVMFGDFECPYSKQAAETVRRVMAHRADDVRLIYRHYPLTTIHPHAAESAIASECAFEQGKFWPYFDKLYLNQNERRTTDLLRFAQEVGLDGEQFSRCVADNRYAKTVEEDFVLSQSLALRGTPIFFFNGIRVEGEIPEADLEYIIDRLMK